MILVKKSAIPMVSLFLLSTFVLCSAFLFSYFIFQLVINGVMVFYTLHAENMTPAQKVVLMHLTHHELSRKKACYQQDGMKEK